MPITWLSTIHRRAVNLSLPIHFSWSATKYTRPAYEHRSADLGLFNTWQIQSLFHCLFSQIWPQSITLLIQFRLLAPRHTFRRPTILGLHAPHVHSSTRIHSQCARGQACLHNVLCSIVLYNVMFQPFPFIPVTSSLRLQTVPRTLPATPRHQEESTVGGVAEWVERWSRPANFPYPTPDC